VIDSDIIVHFFIRIIEIASTFVTMIPVAVVINFATFKSDLPAFDKGLGYFPPG